MLERIATMTSKNMAKQLVSSGLVLVALSYCGAKTDSLEGEVRRLQADIPSLYLINGMSLSADQSKQLAGFLAEGAKIQEQDQRAIRQFMLNNQRDIDPLLDQIITGIQEETGQAPAMPKGRPGMPLQKLRYEWQYLMNRNQHDLDGIAQKTMEILTMPQRDILQRFVPCFIPPGDFCDPERAGQDNGEPRRTGGADELEKIKRYILNPGIGPVIAKRSGNAAPALKQGIVPSALYEDVKEKNEIFQTAILINNLLLTAEQARGLLPCVRRAAKARSEIALEAAVIFPQALTAYAALKKELENQQSSPQTEDEAAKYYLQLKMLYAEKLAKTILNCQAELEQALSADQVSFLVGRQNSNERQRAPVMSQRNRFAPDSGRQAGAPRQNMDRPGGAWQNEQAKQNIAAIRSRALSLFNSMEQMNDKEFANRGRDLCASFVEFCLSSGAIEPDVIDSKAEVDRAVQILTRARNMRRPDYTKARDELVAEVCPRRSPESCQRQTSQGGQPEVPSQSIELLLSQTGLTLLEKKIKLGN